MSIIGAGADAAFKGEAASARPEAARKRRRVMGVFIFKCIFAASRSSSRLLVVVLDYLDHGGADDVSDGLRVGGAIGQEQLLAT